VSADHVERVEVARILPVTREGLGRETTLEWGESKLMPLIASDDEPREAIAKPADAIVENDVVFRHASLLVPDYQERSF
jgi:hypothetical protein